MAKDLMKMLECQPMVKSGTTKVYSTSNENASKIPKIPEKMFVFGVIQSEWSKIRTRTTPSTDTF